MPKRKYSNEDMQIFLYNSIFDNYNVENLENVIKKICINFNSDMCKDIFKEFIINIFYTIVIIKQNSSNIITPSFIKKIHEFKEKSSYLKDTAILPINLNIQQDDIENFLYLLQVHTFGTFKSAHLAYLTHDLLQL